MFDSTGTTFAVLTGGHTLRARLLVAVLGLVSTTAVLVGGLAYVNARAIVVAEAERAVDLVADARKDALLTALNNQHARAAGFMHQFDRLSREDTSPEGTRRLLAGYLATTGASSALLTRTEDRRIVAVGPADELAGLKRVLPPNDSQVALFYHDAHGPYFTIHAVSRRGELLAHFPIAPINALFVHTTGLGNEGETFLADAKGQPVTPTRFPTADAPIVAPAMRACLGGADAVTVDQDYRGVTTVMSYRYVKAIGGGAIMAHMSRTEAFAPLDELARQLASGLAALLLLGALCAVALARTLSRPIERLQARVVGLRAGDYTSPVPQDGPFEVRTFAAAFSEMAAGVKASHDELERRVAERTRDLEEQRRFTEGLIQHLPAGVAYFSPELRFEAMNQLYCEMFDLDRTVLGQPFTAIYGGETGERQAAKLRRVIETGEPGFDHDFEFRGSRFDIIRIPLLGPDGQQGVLVHVLDVAARWRLMRELAQQRDLTQSILANAPVMIAYLDHDLVYRWNNPRHELLTGRPAEEVLGRHVSEVLHPDILSRMLPIYRQVIESGQPYHATALPLRFGDRPEVYLDINYIPMADEHGGGRGLLVMSTDVTTRVMQERMQAEQIEQLKHVDRMKDRFFGILSHELRTPLNAVLGFASVLDDEVLGPLTPDQHRYLEKILGGTEVLLALINDLLDMSRIQAGKFSLAPEPVRFEAIARETLGNLAALADRKDERLVNAVPDGLPDLVADGQRVGQVLVNLVGNAIKFTPPGGTIRLEAAVQGAELRVAVSDTGIGIAGEDLDRLFLPFTQLDSGNNRAAGGTGLGLSIAKALVEAHGGRIGLESTPSVGSTFWFTLPLSGPKG